MRGLRQNYVYSSCDLINQQNPRLNIHFNNYPEIYLTTNPISIHCPILNLPNNSDKWRIF